LQHVKREDEVSARQRDCGHLLVADGDVQLRGNLVRVLREAGYTALETGLGSEAVDLVRCERPDLIVLEVDLPGLSGYEVCRRVREEHGSTPLILFVSGDRTDSLDRVAGLLLGGDDYLLKPFAEEELLARTRVLLRRLAERPGNGHVGSLTARERQVLSLLADGLDQRQIAERLVISRKTVGTHIERILLKLEVHSRAQAVAVAFRANLVE
jgi:DNA-binding NarL/FixJ family response regulator